jgi:hydroxyethylthiazole kinase-like uncharacterized protein yjeF
MQKVLTPEQMKDADARTIDSGVASFDLMERAGAAVGRVVSGAMGGTYGRRVTIICGKGNNGGDGLVAASWLARRGAICQVWTLEDPEEFRGDAAKALAGFSETEVRRFSSAGFAADLARSDAAVDAMFGTGFRGALEGSAAKAAAALNEINVPVVAVDIPSGVDGLTGAVPGEAVKATQTVTLAALKPGLLLQPGADHAGEVRVADIGISESAMTTNLALVERADVAEVLPPRPSTAHKRSVGKVLVVAGSETMSGAAVLAALGALRAGAGLVRIAVPRPIVDRVAPQVVEALTVGVPATSQGGFAFEAADDIVRMAEGADSVALGPGIGRELETSEFVRQVLRRLDRPVVLDADGINALRGKPQGIGRRKARTLLTPHSGELGRLLGKPASEIDADRLAAVREGARLTECHVLLKGPCTLIAKPSGTVVMVSRGGPVLATGGTGDVLTGVLAALGAGVGLFQAGWAGAYLHSAAGDMLAAQVADRGVVASDVARMIPQAIREVRADL